MKAVLVPTFILFASAQAAYAAPPAVAANPCGEPAGAYMDYDSSRAVSRTITRYKKGNAYIYSYELDIAGVVPQDPGLHDGESYAVKVALDGKTALTQGHMSCTTAAATPIIDGRCIDPANPGPSEYSNISEPFFTYASNGDHLNVWDGEISVLNPSDAQWDAPTKFRFPEKKFSEMKFQ